jgi:hypothetical protein
MLKATRRPITTPAYCLIDAEDSEEKRTYPALFTTLDTVSC